MRYEVTHTTEYDYGESVSLAHHVARLRPRTLPLQACLDHELSITPSPAATSAYDDYFGNPVTLFGVQGTHKSLVIKAHSTVSVSGPVLPSPKETPPWETTVDRETLPFEAIEYVFDSPESRTLFGVETYVRVAQAYLAGLEAFARRGGDLSKAASVASFFVSRIDTSVDKLLEELQTPRNKPEKPASKRKNDDA